MSLIFLASIISTVDDPFQPIPQNGAIPRRPGLSNGPIPPNLFPSTLNFPFSHCSNAPPSPPPSLPPPHRTDSKQSAPRCVINRLSSQNVQTFTTHSHCKKLFSENFATK